LSTTSEVIHCPNCKEDVPRTLYCLNCGYPLYKLEQEKKSEEQTEEPVTEIEPEPEVTVDMSVEYEPPQETFMAEETEPVIEPEPEPIPEPEVEIRVEEEPETAWGPEPEEEPSVEPEPEVEAEPEPAIAPEVETALITPEDREKYMMDEIQIEFAPDPLTKEIMDNLAKNITLKVRLVRLLRDNSVKEETFRKLFDSYVDQGRLWVSRRDDIITRFRADMERMENEFVIARKDFELLEIRKNIGDAGENEYSVKAPAYKWDIEYLDTEINNCKGGIQYMTNLKSLVPGEEVSELETLGEADYSGLDNIEGITSDTIARIKETLADALNTLQG
jgi:hypothetical protein